jgi:hypothetical protein
MGVPRDSLPALIDVRRMPEVSMAIRHGKRILRNSRRLRRNISGNRERTGCTVSRDLPAQRSLLAQKNRKRRE